MLTTALPSPKSNFSSPYLFFGELKSGLFQLSSDLSRVLGVADEGPCRFDLVMRRLLADECDRVVLRECFEEFARERTKLDQCVRIRLQGRIVWCRIRARAFKSDAGENVLVSGTVDFFSFQRIITELLRFSDFGPDEVDLLSRFAAADARRTLCVIRLESEDWKSAAFQDISDQIVRSLRGTMPHAVTVEQLDANTILFSAPDASLEFRDRVERLVDTVLRENYAETNVKPVIFISEGSGDHNEVLTRRLGLWRDVSNLYTNTLSPDKFSFREIVFTAQACLNDFSGFRLLLQPLVDKTTLQYTGCEFLLRFQTDLGFGPDRFVRLLEQSELALPLTRWVFGNAVAQASELLPVIPQDFAFHVNMNPSHTDDRGFYRFLRHSAQLHGVPLERIVIEFVETGDRISQADLARLVANCRRDGVRIAIDDFGTCYNSLLFLLQVPCDMVKFSREISLQCLFDEKRRHFLAQLLGAFRELGLRTSLEGIQDAEMFATLSDVDVDDLQGYYFSEPVSADHLRRLLAPEDGHTKHSEPEVSP